MWDGFTDPPRGGGAGANPVADKDVARTFAESGLSLTHSATSVVAEGIELADAGPTVNLPQDTQETGRTETMGIVINPNEELTQLRVTTGPFLSGATSLRIETTGGSVLDEVANPAGGTAYDMTATLTAGTDYYILVDAGGNSYTNSVASANYPYTSSRLDVTAGYYNGSIRSTWVWNIDAVAPMPVYNGTCYLEWAMPRDLYAWDTGVYLATLNGGTVDVVLEEETSPGTWNEVGTISRGDGLDADPANNIRYRVDFSRSSGAGYPRLESAARRWKL